ncbi:MAG: DUF87 domain-containing protein [Oscillospiraceae bacterium]|nr:DUF87 domain-containing protein [Oscillospiraceae bacterium]
MGIITNVKEYLHQKKINAARKAADKLTAVSVLSPTQLEETERKRQAYLTQKPNMTGMEAQETIRKNLGAVGIEVHQAYLEQIGENYIPVDTGVQNFDEINRIRYFDIKKWVVEAEEKNLDKLSTVYQVLNEENCNIALIYHRTAEECKVTIGVVNTDEKMPDPAKAKTYIRRLENAVQGNFPGAEIVKNQGRKDSFGIGIPECLRSAYGKGNGDVKSIAIVSNLASEKSENFISQSMEKLLDGVVPINKEEEYTIVLLAQPIYKQLEKKNRLFELYSSLAPFASWQTNYTYTTSHAVTSSADALVNLGTGIGAQFTFHVGIQASTNFGVQFARSSSVNVQMGMNDSLTQNYVNYGVQHTMELIEAQIKRLEESAALGMWEFAAYVISKSPVIANNVAHMYLALTQGEESFMTHSAVTLLDGDEKPAETRSVLQSIQKLQHPVFGLKNHLDAEWLMYPILVTPSAILSGKELAKALNFPRRSVNGLPVLESTAFGREVQKFENSDSNISNMRKITIGSISHMHHIENKKVTLDINSLTSHVLVTGSTGTGKSNAIYQILSMLQREGKQFLVIEPAKGEYKKIFGGRCKVYGTNTNHSELLCTNPFSFPEGIHVLEHIDRLVEIFNACWPMYAAMPAVLKDAIEQSYESVGWNLLYSRCEPKIFPTFSHLMKCLPKVMEQSLYSGDTKNDYAGALITRVHSLTNGINGLIFCSGHEILNEELFENDVIIDLSRVGSSETKSLIMGILVMKLQEYRLNLEHMNQNLLHVTVIEEAHQLLRRTSLGQTQESANLQGKSVEMLTNSIAEMRTYGEGFLIIDQSPELLDEAVIRNTNTKIAFRLPNETDRTAVGAAMVLNENQIAELARLPKGVAAVYQNDWVEAVLCQFEKFLDERPLVYHKKQNDQLIRHFLRKVFGISDNYEISIEDADILKQWIQNMRTAKITENVLCSVLNGHTLSETEKMETVYNLFEGKKISDCLYHESDIQKGILLLERKIRVHIGFSDDVLIQSIRNIMISALNEITIKSFHRNDLFQQYVDTISLKNKL